MSRKVVTGALWVGLFVACTIVVARAQPPAWRWREPGCFAYAPARQAYACIAMEATPSAGRPYDVSTDRLDDSYSVAQVRGARIALGVLPVAIGEHPFDVEPLWRQAPDPTATTLSRSALGAWLVRNGFTQRVQTRRWLSIEPDWDDAGQASAGSWVRVGRAAYRFETWVREGDASFEMYGRLLVRCRPDEAPRRILADQRLGGPLAMLSKAQGASVVVLTIEHHDGGEGYVDVHYQHFPFDEAVVCGR